MGFAIAQVSIEPEPPKGFHRAIMDQAVARHTEKLQGAIPAYDGQRALYTARELAEQVELDVEFIQDNEGPRRYPSLSLSLSLWFGLYSVLLGYAS